MFVLAPVPGACACGLLARPRRFAAGACGLFAPALGACGLLVRPRRFAAGACGLFAPALGACGLLVRPRRFAAGACGLFARPRRFATGACGLFAPVGAASSHARPRFIEKTQDAWDCKRCGCGCGCVCYTLFTLFTLTFYSICQFPVKPPNRRRTCSFLYVTGNFSV